MKTEITPVDLCLVFWVCFAGGMYSYWWLAAVPVLLISWVINPRWNKRDGWRFLR